MYKQAPSPNGHSSTKVRLYDGRSQEIVWDKPFAIEGTDFNASYNFDFRPIDLETHLGKALAETFVMRCGRNVPQTLKALNSIIVSLLNISDQGVSLSKGALLNIDAGFVPGLKPLFYSFLRDVAEYSPECFTSECIDHLYSMRGKSRKAYADLRKNDPEKGAYTEQELFSIRSSVNQAFEAGRIDLREFAFVWTLIATGLRPIQICRMRISDVKILNGPDGKEVNLLVPLAKSPHAGERPAKWMRRCPTVLATILIRFLEEQNARYGVRFDPNGSLFEYADYDVGNLFKDAPRDKGKLTREIVAQSERTGGVIRINPKRFRYTLATRAIAFGASDHEAARLMTHTSTNSIKHYRASLPIIMKPIKEALGGHMNIIANAFQGRVIEGISEASRSSEKEALVRDFMNLGGQQIGACGTNADCYQNAPVSCLTCDKFEAFRDAPWNELMKALQEDMEQEQEDRIKLITLEAINAVSQILEQLNESN